MLKMQTPSACLFIRPEVTFVLFQPNGQKAASSMSGMLFTWYISRLFLCSIAYTTARGYLLKNDQCSTPKLHSYSSQWGLCNKRECLIMYCSFCAPLPLTAFFVLNNLIWFGWRFGEVLFILALCSL